MESRLLVKMRNSEHGLEEVMAAVRECQGQVKNLSARLSLDNSLFFITMEVSSDTHPSDILHRIENVRNVKAVEFQS